MRRCRSASSLGRSAFVDAAEEAAAGVDVVEGVGAAAAAGVAGVEGCAAGADPADPAVEGTSGSKGGCADADAGATEAAGAAALP